MPQALSEVPSWLHSGAEPGQQPVQVIVSQVHSPLTQSTSVAHAEHVAPPRPQEPGLCWSNVSHGPANPATQQPFAHETPSQMHTPPSPHRYPALHEMHTAPPTPQSEFWLPGSQVVPSQHPEVHAVVSQTHCCCGLHSLPSGQAWQLAPPLPQKVLVVPSWQLLLESQQPFGHEVGSQVQTPFAHS